MRVYLVHHGEAVGADVDPRRPLSIHGREEVARLAAEAAALGAHPAVVWHSGKLRARQTAEAFWRACNALADFSATRDLQPEDRPEWMLARLNQGTRDVLLAGHYPHLPRLAALLAPGMNPAGFPQHGVIAFESTAGPVWRETWRLEAR